MALRLEARARQPGGEALHGVSDRQGLVKGSVSTAGRCREVRAPLRFTADAAPPACSRRGASRVLRSRLAARDALA